MSQRHSRSGAPRAKRPAPVSQSRSRRVSAAQARGLEAFRRMDYQAAISELEEAIRHSPAEPLLRAQLGAALRAAGRTAEAIATYRSALELPADPALPLIHNNLGNALRDAGDLAASTEHLETAVQIKPDYPEAWYNLAVNRLRLGLNGSAEEAVGRALAGRPDYPDALGLLAELLGLRGAFEKAVEASRQLVVLEPDRAEHRIRLSWALKACGRFEESEAEVEQAERVAPSDLGVVYALARQQEQRGKREAAVAAYRRVIAANPRHASAYLSLAAAAVLSDAELAAAERAASSSEFGPDERATFAFAAARSYDRSGAFDRAFLWARFANSIDGQRTGFSEADAANFVLRSMATFSRSSFDEGATGSSDERPVFIVGFPRSGTSLVEQIIASHPLACPGGELVEFPDIVKELGPSYPDCVPSMSQEQTDVLVARYRARLDRVDSRAIRITDKLPFNFRSLGLIARLFPGARVIYCRRDPRDVAISCYFIRFHRPISFTRNFYHFGAYWRLHEVLMRHWRKALPIQVLQVDYERLVAEPEVQIREMIDFVRLPWDARCLRFYAAESVVRTASASQIRNPIYAASVGRWRNYARHLAPLLSELQRDPKAIMAKARIAS